MNTFGFFKKIIEALKSEEKTDWLAMKTMCEGCQETNKTCLEKFSGKTEEQVKFLQEQKLDLGVCRIIVDIFCD